MHTLFHSMVNSMEFFKIHRTLFALVLSQSPFEFSKPGRNIFRITFFFPIMNFNTNCQQTCIHSSHPLSCPTLLPSPPPPNALCDALQYDFRFIQPDSQPASLATGRASCVTCTTCRLTSLIRHIQISCLELYIWISFANQSTA